MTTLLIVIIVVILLAALLLFLIVWYYLRDQINHFKTGDPKENDQNYTIHAVSGLIFFMDKKNSKNDCLKMHEEIKKEISSMLKNIKPTKQEKKIIEHDETGNSVHYPIYYDFNELGFKI